ncbi:MAG: hypothetical protein KC621_24960, partial [Myxococcales bacterium]|nr:hypothetical protein [Myxococcales bacterium]
FVNAPARVVVVDQQGMILMDPERQSIGTPTPYPNPAVVEAMRARRSGSIEVGDEIVIYTRMSSLDWYYVVSGSTEALLDVVR